jgi:ATP-dependent Clp protease ATP-binding subunit ClpA
MKTSRKQFKLDNSSSAIKNLINIELKKFFHPEFLNRRDEIIIFKPLEKETITVISHNIIEKLIDRLSEKDFFYRFLITYVEN